MCIVQKSDRHLIRKLFQIDIHLNSVLSNTTRLLLNQFVLLDRKIYVRIGIISSSVCLFEVRHFTSDHNLVFALYVLSASSIFWGSFVMHRINRKRVASR